MLILLFRYAFAILAGGPAIPRSPGWTGPPTNRVGSRGGRASRESEFLAGGPEHCHIYPTHLPPLFLLRGSSGLGSRDGGSDRGKSYSRSEN